ncbi:dephospho-CoA kinase [Arsenophonus symbiont of Ornithomya chloropus]|uniref:dephospho-CoA kinase n=1 Tax=Arsenophonus symbiont of Ornithomya chloropus TaxID=634121 RepID=UPI0032B22320
MSYIVALTGGIGSGKSTISYKFSLLGIPIIDADTIARKIVLPNTYAFKMIKQHFGLSILHKNGFLNRSMLKKRIFDDQEEKTWLNNLLHPLIHQETQLQLSCFNVLYILWVAPLLMENKRENLAHRILVVDVTAEEQIARIMKRDHINRKIAKNIVLNQISRKKRLEKADDIIYNYSNNKNLNITVLKLHKKYLTLATNYHKNKKEYYFYNFL